ncbi:MAG TPA: hypothetical protein VMS30_02325 [Phycisphaerales bacterium]|nr:hypothetical protein [Phycisphaerales bacterium]
MRLSRLYLWTIAGTVAAGVAALANEFLGIIYARDLGEVLFVCMILTLGYAIVGLACATVYERGKSPGLMRSGMIVGLVALVGWFAALLVPPLREEFDTVRVVIWPTVWACLMMLVGVLLLLPMYDGWRWWLRGVTLCLLGAFGLFIAGAVTFYPYPPMVGSWESAAWEQLQRYEEGAYQIGGAIALLAGGALATTLIAGIMHAISGRAKQIATVRTPYWLRCPRCGRAQQAVTGEYHCTQCRLRTKVEFT